MGQSADDPLEVPEESGGLNQVVRPAAGRAVERVMRARVMAAVNLRGKGEAEALRSARKGAPFFVLLVRPFVALVRHQSAEREEQQECLRE